MSDRLEEIRNMLAALHMNQVVLDDTVFYKQDVAYLLERLEHSDNCQVADLEGMAARLTGKGVATCPYPEGDYRSCWELGWQRQDAELQLQADLSTTRTRLEEIRKLVERWHHIGHLSYKLGPRTTDLTERLGKHTIVVTGPKFEECDNLLCQALRGEPVGERE